MQFGFSEWSLDRQYSSESVLRVAVTRKVVMVLVEFVYIGGLVDCVQFRQLGVDAIRGFVWKVQCGQDFMSVFICLEGYFRRGIRSGAGVGVGGRGCCSQCAQFFGGRVIQQGIFWVQGYFIYVQVVFRFFNWEIQYVVFFYGFKDLGKEIKRF